MKRKIELVDSVPNKVNVVTKSKAPLKADLIKELKDLQTKFDTLEIKNKSLKNENEALEDTNTKFLEVIKCLNERVDNFEKEKEAFSKQTQTESGIQLKCDECNFEAKDNSELSWHLSENHGWPQDHKPDELDMSEGPRHCDKCDYEAEDGYDLDAHGWTEHEEDASELDVHTTKCVGEALQFNFCDKTFQTLKNLMHKKQDHLENVAACWNFSYGNCELGENLALNTTLKIPQTPKSLNAQNVEKTF